jgi:hypothetical protein
MVYITSGILCDYICTMVFIYGVDGVKKLVEKSKHTMWQIASHSFAPWREKRGFTVVGHGKLNEYLRYAQNRIKEKKLSYGLWREDKLRFSEKTDFEPPPKA